MACPEWSTLFLEANDDSELPTEMQKNAVVATLPPLAALKVIQKLL